MKATVLRKYAELIARAGVNVQKGDEVIVTAELDQPKFVEYVVDACYKAGAKKVIVEFTHQPLEKLHVRHRSLTTLSKVEDWEVKRFEHYIDVLPSRIWLVSEDPDGLAGMNYAKYAKGAQNRSKIIWKTSTSGASRRFRARSGQRSSSPTCVLRRRSKSCGSRSCTLPVRTARIPSRRGDCTTSI